MTSFTTEAIAPDGTPRRLAGTSRRPYADYASAGGYIMCQCGTVLQTTQQGLEHWQAGHFDFPIYHAEEPI